MVRQKSRTREVNTILLELEANRGLPFLIPTGKLPNARDAPSIPLELNPHRRAARAPCQQAQFRAVVQEWEAEAAPSAYWYSEEQRTRAGSAFAGLGPTDFKLQCLLLVMRWLKKRVAFIISKISSRCEILYLNCQTYNSFQEREGSFLPPLSKQTVQRSVYTACFLSVPDDTGVTPVVTHWWLYSVLFANAAHSNFSPSRTDLAGWKLFLFISPAVP